MKQQQAVNARAEWEAFRSPEALAKAAAKATRKAQLTDEAYGEDNPQEATPRIEKDITAQKLHTPHTG